VFSGVYADVTFQRYLLGSVSSDSRCVSELALLLRDVTLSLPGITCSWRYLDPRSGGSENIDFHLTSGQTRQIGDLEAQNQETVIQ